MSAKPKSKKTPEAVAVVAKDAAVSGAVGDTPQAPSEPQQLHIVAGTYNHFLHGLGGAAVEGQATWPLKARYSYESHAGSVTATVARASILVSGSADEMIKIYDLNKQVEVGTLVHHEGTITALEFFGLSHLISAGVDGKVCIWDAQTWSLLKELPGHHGAVHSLSIHPSGRLCLSVGADKTLRTWNLVKGRSAFITNLKEEAHLVRWSPDGGAYLVVFADHMEVYSTATGQLTQTIKLAYRVLQVLFLSDTRIIVCGYSESVAVYDVVSGVELGSFVAHENRVKAMSLAAWPAKNASAFFLATASSDGNIKLWELTLSDKGAPVAALRSEVDTNSRLTCLFLVNRSLPAPPLPPKVSQPQPALVQKTKQEKLARKETAISEEEATAQPGKLKKPKQSAEDKSENGSKDRKRKVESGSTVVEDANDERAIETASKKHKKHKKDKVGAEDAGAAVEQPKAKLGKKELVVAAAAAAVAAAPIPAPTVAASAPSKPAVWNARAKPAAPASVPAPAASAAASTASKDSKSKKPASKGGKGGKPTSDPMFEVVKAEAAQAAPWVFDNDDDDDDTTGGKAWPRPNTQDQRPSRYKKQAGSSAAGRGGRGGARGGHRGGPRTGPKRGPGGKLKPAFGRPG